MEPFFGVKFTLVEPAGIISAFLGSIPQRQNNPVSEAESAYGPI